MKPTALLTLVLLAACARSEDASVGAEETNGGGVEQVRSTGGDDQEPALGDWRMALQGERPSLEFGPQGATPVITMVCGDRGGLILQRNGALAPGSSPTLSISVSGQGRQLPVSPGTGPTPTQYASIAPGDTLIQQMAAAQAPIALRFGGDTPLILPRSPLIGQFAQTCAGGGESVAGATETNGAAAAAGGNSAQPANDTNAAPAH
ncbi:MAG TPA: hypothetical protein VF702_04760 [Allosphingosinicella sp.]|jgi:hypothetical protein